MPSVGSKAYGLPHPILSSSYPCTRNFWTINSSCYAYANAAPYAALPIWASIYSHDSSPRVQFASPPSCSWPRYVPSPFVSYKYSHYSIDRCSSLRRCDDGLHCYRDTLSRSILPLGGFLHSCDGDTLSSGLPWAPYILPTCFDCSLCTSVAASVQFRCFDCRLWASIAVFVQFL